MTLRRPRRWSAAVVAMILGAVLVAVVPATAKPILRAAGRALVLSEQAGPADVIVITNDSGGAGALQAADLVQQGIATRVAVFTDPPSGEDLEFIRRGLPYEDAAARQIRQLYSLGITDVMKIPREQDGSGGEGRSLAVWSDQHAIGSIVLVAASDHSRRLRRVLDRDMRGHSARVTVQAERYSGFDPECWWQTRHGARVGIIELEKLALDFVLHPLSF
ncbi:hypothetical protein; putative signal peptide [Bradyrhizobium sp. ORS 278]|uniref:hypothetical protein n=1 Tax=Bradyrhizobium sp. (strain ORS 278) TaxID=114615 RepID=UPI00015087AC|nr:hypothetical protein [Bradyrhizobium sp. ORS 278]CAL78549.1 hypothetical protein; putative signal peptide [Bradyrhizobium sp. ORS 278]